MQTNRANGCNLAHIIVSGSHESVVHYERDQVLGNTGKISFQFFMLMESHYANLPFITDVSCNCIVTRGRVYDDILPELYPLIHRFTQLWTHFYV